MKKVSWGIGNPKAQFIRRPYIFSLAPTIEPMTEQQLVPIICWRDPMVHLVAIAYSTTRRMTRRFDLLVFDAVPNA